MMEVYAMETEQQEDVQMEPSVAISQNKTKKITKTKREQLILQCELGNCRTVFNDMDDLLRHISEHIRKLAPVEILCLWKDCGYTANHTEELIRHIYFHAFHSKIKSIGASILRRRGITGCSLDSQGRNLIPELPESLHCGWGNCEDVYNNPEFFYRHIDRHAENCPRGNNPRGGVICQWEGCESHFQNRHKLRDHLRSHSQEKVAACPTCGGLFANRTKFLDHIKRQVPLDMQNYQCSHCSKRFSSERLLRDHMRTHVNHYKCPYCDMTCPSPSSLNNHIRYRHTDEKPFSCEYCDYSCKSYTDLRRHLETHNAEAPYKCSYQDCKYSTRSLQSFTIHNRKVHQGDEVPRYMCHICDKLFTRGSYLTKHLINKHKFRWPSGHSRFRYKCDDDGFHKLQTVRYESIELTQEMIDIQLEETEEMQNESLSDSSAKGETATSSLPSENVIELPVNSDGSVTISIEHNEDGTVVVQTVSENEKKDELEK